MNCVDYAINEVINGGDISEYVLELAFSNPNQNIVDNWSADPVNYSVEQGLRERVIHGVVLKRCNVQGGVTEYLDLTGSSIINIGNSKVQVQVPDFITGGRKIVSVPEVYQGSIGASSGVLSLAAQNIACGEGTLNDMLSGMINGMRSNRAIPQTFTNIQMVGNNTFVISNCPAGVFSMTARAILESDDNLSHINPRAYPYFSKLVQFATKAFIYKNCRNKINEGVVRGGVNVDSIKDEIYGYQDAWKDYDEYFQEEWLAYMSYSDTQRKAESIRASTPRRM